MMKYFLNIFFCFSFTSSFAQYAYKDTTTFPPPKQIARIESHDRRSEERWVVALNPGDIGELG